MRSCFNQPASAMGDIGHVLGDSMITWLLPCWEQGRVGGNALEVEVSLAFDISQFLDSSIRHRPITAEVWTRRDNAKPRYRCHEAIDRR